MTPCSSIQPTVPESGLTLRKRRPFSTTSKRCPFEKFATRLETAAIRSRRKVSFAKTYTYSVGGFGRRRLHPHIATNRIKTGSKKDGRKTMCHERKTARRSFLIRG